MSYRHGHGITRNRRQARFFDRKFARRQRTKRDMVREIDTSRKKETQEDIKIFAVASAKGFLSGQPLKGIASGLTAVIVDSIFEAKYGID